MNVNRMNIVLAVLLFIVLCLEALWDADPSQPNYEFLPNMKRSGASHAYSANAVFPDGRTMQTPVPGTIARGDLPMYYAATKEDAVRAGEELRNPFAAASGAASALRSGGSAVEESSATPAVQTTAEKGSAAVPDETATSDPAERLRESVRRGAESYTVYCVSCHGATGAGDGPVAKRGFPPPPPLPSGKSAQMKDGQLFHILTYGQGSMSPMAAQLSRDRRWDVINFVRSLQQGAAAPAAPEPAATAVPDGLTVPGNADSDAPGK